MTITEYIERTAESFEEAELCFAHGTDNALDEAVYLVFSSLGLDFDLDYRKLGRELSSKECELLDSRVRRRIENREPVAYLVGEAWFCGIPFHCDSRALIPRSPIAELISNSFEPLCTQPPHRILDMCTGGGCIGIACALQFPDALVELVDISSESLKLASKNISRHGTSDRVHVIRSDLFAEVEGRFDLIVANPPYVSTRETDELPPEFLHEPRLGLESAEDGLAIPLQILRAAEDYLADAGVLILEVGYSANRLQERLQELPLLWLDFEQGGEGVMAITARELHKYRALLI